MLKYVIVLGGNRPGGDNCNYLSGVDKNGLKFSRDVDEAITFTDKDRCVYLARGLVTFKTVDVYSVKYKTLRSYEFVW